MSTRPDIEIERISDDRPGRRGSSTEIKITGLTDAGIEFVDGYLASGLVVIDSGIVAMSADEVADGFVAAANERGLTVLREAD